MINYLAAKHEPRAVLNDVDHPYPQVHQHRSPLEEARRMITLMLACSLLPTCPLKGTVRLSLSMLMKIGNDIDIGFQVRQQCGSKRSGGPSVTDTLRLVERSMTGLFFSGVQEGTRRRCEGHADIRVVVCGQPCLRVAGR